MCECVWRFQLEAILFDGQNITSSSKITNPFWYSSSANFKEAAGAKRNRLDASFCSSCDRCDDRLRKRMEIARQWQCQLESQPNLQASWP